MEVIKIMIENVMLSLSKETFELTKECLLTLKEYLKMIDKLPIKKSKKLQGRKFVAVLDNLIIDLEKGVIKND